MWKVLTASVRSMDHFLARLKLGSDIITALLTSSGSGGEGLSLPAPACYDVKGLRPIPYRDISPLRRPGLLRYRHEADGQRHGKVLWRTGTPS